MSKRLASCSCGQLTAEVTGDPVRISICHCLACQRRTGSVFAEQARFLARMCRSQATQPNTSVWAMKVQVPGFISARSAARPFTTS